MRSTTPECGDLHYCYRRPEERLASLIDSAPPAPGLPCTAYSPSVLRRGSPTIIPRRLLGHNASHRTLRPAMRAALGRRPEQPVSVAPEKCSTAARFMRPARSKGLFLHLRACLLVWRTGDVSQSPTRCRTCRPPSDVCPHTRPGAAKLTIFP